MIEDAYGKKITMMKYGANWCGPCRMLKAWLDRHYPALLEEMVVVNTDDNPEHEYIKHVKGLPTLLILDDKINLEVFSGLNECKEYVSDNFGHYKGV